MESWCPSCKIINLSTSWLTENTFLQSGKLDFVKSLMDFDPKLLAKDKLGNTPIHYAAEKYPEVLNSMLKKAQEFGMSIKLHKVCMQSKSKVIILPCCVILQK